MLEIKRLITDNAFTYEKVQLMDWKHEQMAKGIGKYITQDDLIQIVIKTTDGKIRVLTDWMVGVIEVKRMKVPSCAEKVEQIVLNGEISFGPAWLIEPREYKQCNVPKVFKHQLSFVADDSLYICHQEALIEIVLSPSAKKWKKHK